MLRYTSLGGCSSVKDELETVSQSIDFNDLRYKNAYLILSEYFSHVLPNLNEFVAGQVSPFLSNTIEFSLHWHISVDFFRKICWPL